MVFVILGYTGYRISQDVFRPRSVSRIVNVDPDTRIASEWQLGTFQRVRGTDYLIAPVYSAQVYQVSYYEKGALAVRNYLFVNVADKSSRWLVPHNHYLFLIKEELESDYTYLLSKRG